MTPKSDPHISPSSLFDDTISPRMKISTHKTTNEATTSPLIQNDFVFRSLFMDTYTSSTMDKPWLIAAFKALDVSKFPDAPHPFLDKYEEWLHKFSGANAITTEKNMHRFYRVIGARLIQE